MDTNAIVCLLRGESALEQRLKSAVWVGISILSEIEFLAFPNLSENDRRILHEFSDGVEVVGLGRTERALIDRIVGLRAQHRLKLPDAIIAATAVERDATLITDDRQLLMLPAIRSASTSTSE